MQVLGFFAVLVFFFFFFFFRLATLFCLDFGKLLRVLGCGVISSSSGRENFQGRRLSVSWGKMGMLWAGVLPEVHRFTRLDRPPDVLVLHVGGNYLVVLPFRELILDIKFDLWCLWALFPGSVTVW